MKAICITGLMTVAILGFLGGAPALAGTITVADSTGSTWGGEFLSTVVTGFQNNPAGSQYRSFCLEMNEIIRLNGTVYTVVVSDAASHGGVGGGDPDPLDPMTAYLYHGFRAGTLVDTNGDTYGAGNATQDILDANDLQYAIWYIEQEFPRNDSWVTSGTGFDADYNRYTRVAYDAVNGSNATWSGLGDVRVFRLYDAAGRDAQDQIGIVAVPLPAAALPGIALLLGLGVVRARRRRVRLT
jgi:hypothetical protein